MTTFHRLTIILIAALVVGCDRASPRHAESDRKAPTGETTPALRPRASAQKPAPSGEIATVTPSSIHEREVIEAVASRLGRKTGDVALDEPILDERKGVGEFELIEILLELEDRFDTEIDEDLLESVTGGRFDDIQKELTPRQLFQVVATAKHPRS